jgi:intraflagellar transport protein 122
MQGTLKSIVGDRLAVQLPDRLYIYELTSDEMREMRSQPLERLNLEIECNLLVVVSQHFLLCVDRKLQLFTFSGVRVYGHRLDSRSCIAGCFCRDRAPIPSWQS